MRDSPWDKPLRKISWATGIRDSKSLEDSIRRAEQGHVSRVRLAPAVDVPLPEGAPALTGNPVVDGIAEKYFGRTHYWAAPLEAVVIPHASFFPGDSLLVIDDNWVCDELDYDVDVSRLDCLADRFPEKGYRLRDPYAWKAKEAPEIPGVTLIIHPKYHRNYMHWHVEALTQIEFLRRHAGLVDNVLVPGLNEFQSGSLRCLGDGVNLIEAVNPAYRFGCAIVLMHSFLRTWIHPSLGPFLRGLGPTCLEHHGIEPGRSKPVYISRCDSPVRRMINEQSLCDRLDAYGFEIVVAGELTYREQLEAFSGTTLLMSPHGAGLANMIYTRPGTRVVELRPLNARGRSPLYNLSYRILSALIDRPYEAWFFENEEDADEWYIDVERVVASVKALL